MSELIFYMLPSEDGKTGYVPTKKKEDAGYDLKSAYDVVVEAGKQKLIKTNITVGMPNGYYGRIAPRSGLAYKCCINVHAGVTDFSYTGNIGIILFNHGDKNFIVKRGDRIAQLIVTKYLTGEKTKIIWGTPEETERGSAGYGSTGGSAMLKTNV